MFALPTQVPMQNNPVPFDISKKAVSVMANNRRVFIIEDEQDISELMRFNLALEGYVVETFATGEAGFRTLEQRTPDILILDIMLPGMNGLEICKRLKENPATKSVPVIMVTAKGEESDIVRGLELGADDYVTKPFSPKVLLARVDAVLRRSQKQNEKTSDIIRSGAIEINDGRVEASVDGRKLDLTQSEFRILQFLAQRPGWVYTRAQIVEAIRGENYAVTDRTIDFQMVGLRKKLGEHGHLIETVRGVGYRFKDIV
jgi:two-component system, OmpR family, alkaline phosphatase synthesis response regulator PhoP